MEALRRTFTLVLRYEEIEIKLSMKIGRTNCSLTSLPEAKVNFGVRQTPRRISYSKKRPNIGIAKVRVAYPSRDFSASCCSGSTGIASLVLDRRIPSRRFQFYCGRNLKPASSLYLQEKLFPRLRSSLLLFNESAILMAGPGTILFSFQKINI